MPDERSDRLDQLPYEERIKRNLRDKFGLPSYDAPDEEEEKYRNPLDLNSNRRLITNHQVRDSFSREWRDETPVSHSILFVTGDDF